jgi:hypothetical protein
MSADMGDDAAAPDGIDERRGGRPVQRQHAGRRDPPEELAAGGVERRQNAPDPEGEDAAAADGGRRLRTGTVRPRGGIDGVWRGIDCAPDLLARCDVEGAHNFVVPLAGDHHDPIARHDG